MAKLGLAEFEKSLEHIGLQALWESSMETHIHTRWYTSSVGVQHGNTHSHKMTYKLSGSPARKHTFAQDDIQALWESSMETHISTRWYTALWESSKETHIQTRWYTSSVGVQQGNTHSNKMIYKMIHKLCGSPARKHTFKQDDIQDDIQALWEPSKKTHIHTWWYTRWYTSSVGVQQENTH